MAAVYSTKLWEGVNTGGPASIAGPVVVEGVVWILRSIEMMNDVAGDLTPLRGFNLSEASNGGPIFRREGWGIYGATTYAWDGRLVLESGDQLWLGDQDGGWAWLVSGYILTLP